ncbi:hypothetical protein [Acuticoccus kandeliae]|uniref:hypothetical protein n=1 Tax=Acuticoccus kandeliae TaxID=2073160 RepID=UPI001300893A|nr:hypothetical protein [Acuticoccus kandeliae]
MTATARHRHARRRAAAIALATALSGAIHAPEARAEGPLAFSDLVALKDGADACWVRDYDNAHLARHPDQTVTRMALSLDVFHDSDPQTPSLGFLLTARRRGGDGEPGAVGRCQQRDDGVACYAECDGGGFLLRRASSPGAILLDMRHVGWLRLHDCDETEGDTPRNPPLTPGKDDAVFRLDAAPMARCTGP